MKTTTKYQIVKASSKEVYEVIRSEIGKSLFNKNRNLSGELAEANGYDVYSKISYVLFKPNLGPLVKLNVSAKTNNSDNSESQLSSKRINGITYYFQIGFISIVAFIGLIIAIHQMITKSFSEGIGFLTMTIFCLLYILAIELIASSQISSLKKRTKNLLKDAGIKIKKID